LGGQTPKAPALIRSQRTRVAIKSVERLSSTVIQILLEPDSAFDYRADQFLISIRDEGLARSYPITSLPGRDPHLLDVPGATRLPLRAATPRWCGRFAGCWS
jgi:NAD(P)H-flavin reductase